MCSMCAHTTTLRLTEQSSQPYTQGTLWPTYDDINTSLNRILELNKTEELPSREKCELPSREKCERT